MGYGYGRGYDTGPRLFGRRGPANRDVAVAQIEAYLASLRDEVRAIEADLAEIRGGQGTAAPQV
jgi:hypothetical protein